MCCMVRVEYIKVTEGMDRHFRTKEVKWFKSKEEAKTFCKTTNENPKSLFKVFALKEVDVLGKRIDWID